MKRLKIVNVVKSDGEVEIAEAVRKLKLLSFQRSQIEKQEEELKKRINEYVDENVGKDNLGNRYFYTTDFNGNKIILKREARKSATLNKEKAKIFFIKKRLLSKVYKTRQEEYYDEEAIKELVEDGTLQIDELEAIMDVKITYATRFEKEKTDNGIEN